MNNIRKVNDKIFLSYTINNINDFNIEINYGKAIQQNNKLKIITLLNE